MQSSHISTQHTKYEFFGAGRRSGRTLAAITAFRVLLLKKPEAKILIYNIAAVDFAISQGIKPSQIIWSGDRPQKWRRDTDKAIQTILDEPWRNLCQNYLK